MNVEAVFALPSGQLISESQFYAARDHRTTLTAPYTTAEFKIAVGLEPGLEATAQGQAALVWATSMIRRMGRPFARLVVATCGSAKETASQLSLHRSEGITSMGNLVEAELKGADPFAPYDWRDINSNQVFADADFVIWLGSPDSSPHENKRVVVQAIGDVVLLRRSPTPGESRGYSGSIANAEIPTVIFGAALAVGAAYEAAQGVVNDEPTCCWICLRTGEATGDEETGARWIAAEKALLEPGPNAENGSSRRSNLVLVSAGGLGMNVASILAEMGPQFDQVHSIDPDLVDLPGLNRMLGIHVAQIGQFKADCAGAALANGGYVSRRIKTEYEKWSRVNREILDGKGTVVVVGVDQVGSRLSVQADWPPLVVNGSTGSTGWTVSSHSRGIEGCLGCLYADDKRPYSVTRRPAGCAVGIAPLAGALTPTAEASYPFVSVSAAAMIASQLRVQNNTTRGTSRRVSMNALKPSLIRATPVLKNADCLLLCGEGALSSFFSIETDVAEFAASASPARS